MQSPIVFMYSGQGSQYFQMGRQLYERNGRFRLWMDHCDEHAGALLGESLLGRIYEAQDPHAPFDEVAFTNPALLSIEYALSRTLMEQGLRPDYLLGYSFGEVAACVLAGALDLASAMHFAVRYGQALAAQVPAGALLAVMASPTAPSVRRALEASPECAIGGRNCAEHFVLGGPPEAIAACEAGFRQAKVPTQRLPVRHAYHTAMMEPAQAALREIAGPLPWTRAVRPLISASTGELVEYPDDRHLWQVFREPIDFDQSLRGWTGGRAMQFVDVGPSGTLATFAKYSLGDGAGHRYLAALTPFGRDEQSVARVLAA